MKLTGTHVCLKESSQFINLLYHVLVSFTLGCYECRIEHVKI